MFMFFCNNILFYKITSNKKPALFILESIQNQLAFVSVNCINPYTNLYMQSLSAAAHQLHIIPSMNQGHMVIVCK